VTKLKSKGAAVLAALTSKEARGPELALARLILAALGVKLGVNLAELLK
jgi:hypothetical protein